jgi:hypothetical protein
MPLWWELNNDFPQPQNGTPSKAMIAVEGDEIWTAYTYSYSHSVVERYNLVTGEHTIYRIIDGEKIEWVWHILITQDKAVWIVADLDTTFVLARFDREANAFKRVEGNNPFSTWRDTRPPNMGFNLEETLDGNLLIPFQKKIYLYNPLQNVTQQLLPDDFEFSVLSLAVSGNNLWFAVGDSTLTRELWKLDLSTKKLINYGPVPVGYFSSITVDSLGRIWLGYFARLEMNEQGEYQWWYPKSYPTEFIELFSPYDELLLGNEGDRVYQWSWVSSGFVASDDSIWFLADSGIVKYDPYQDTWCLSAPTPVSSIAEDSDGNLWMIPATFQYQGLYKYKLQQ